jgi:hypothetical protein
MYEELNYLESKYYVIENKITILETVNIKVNYVLESYNFLLLKHMNYYPVKEDEKFCEKIKLPEIEIKNKSSVDEEFLDTIKNYI